MSLMATGRQALYLWPVRHFAVIAWQAICTKYYADFILGIGFVTAHLAHHRQSHERGELAHFVNDPALVC